MLVPHPFLDNVTQLRIVDSGIHSDHRPLVAKMLWSPAAGEAARAEKSLHESWRVHELDERGWHQFEEACDEEITDWLADFELASAEVGGDPQQLVDSGFAAWLAAMNRAASATIGVKKVGATSKPFMTREVLSLMRMRKVAARALREVPPGASHVDERLALVMAKWRMSLIFCSVARGCSLAVTGWLGSRTAVCECRCPWGRAAGTASSWGNIAAPGPPWSSCR